MVFSMGLGCFVMRMAAYTKASLSMGRIMGMVSLLLLMVPSTQASLSTENATVLI